MKAGGQQWAEGMMCPGAWWAGLLFLCLGQGTRGCSELMGRLHLCWGFTLFGQLPQDHHQDSLPTSKGPGDKGLSCEPGVCVRPTTARLRAPATLRGCRAESQSRAQRGCGREAMGSEVL